MYAWANPGVMAAALILSVGSGQANAESLRDKTEFMGCLEVFSEPQADRVRVTTLFCGSAEDGQSPPDVEIRQHVTAVIEQSSRAVHYALNTMIRSRRPFSVDGVKTEESQALDFKSQQADSCTPTDSGCWFETAVHVPLNAVFADALTGANAGHRFSYQIESGRDVLNVSFNRHEMEALKLFTEGLVVALPHASTALTGTSI